MVNLLSKKIFFLVVVLFMLGLSGGFASAGTMVVNEILTITAQVGDDVILGGTSGSISIPKTAVRFSGEAYPMAMVTVMKEGKNALTVQADSRGHFDALLPELYDSTVIYTLYAIDTSGNKSLLINYPIVIYAGFLTHLSGIRFAPTIVTDKAEVRFGDYLTLTGHSLPDSDMLVSVEGAMDKNFSLTSATDGTYKIILPMQGLPRGEYVVYVKYVDDERISKLVKFIIGEANILNVDIVENIPGDCNHDGIINLVDFSVLAFWYGKNNPPVCVDTNRDGKIDLVDFSILAFWWTG